MDFTKIIAKAIIGTLTAFGTWGATALQDGGIQGGEWFGLCGVLVVGLSVYAIPNSEA